MKLFLSYCLPFAKLPLASLCEFHGVSSQAVVNVLMSLKDIHAQTGQLEPAEPMFGLETSWPLDENKGHEKEN